jgi:cell division protein FtsQ
MSIGRVKKNYHGLNFSWRKSGKIILVLMLIILCIFSITKFMTSAYFPIKSVKIFGAQHLDRNETQGLIAPLVKNGFFAVDVERIKESISTSPWVGQVIVRRVWPDQVIVAINEKKPIALWNNSSLLSSSGELFTPAVDTIPDGLPQLSGPPGEHLFMAQYYAKMASVLEPLHFKITRLELTPTMTWSITLDNGMKLNVGHKDSLTRLDHFVKVYSKIVGDRVADVEYIDLRYPNGMAVRWKSVT